MNESRPEPVRTATGATVAVTAILTVFFLVARDLGIVIPADTAQAITGALIIVATIVANEWARRRSTPTAAPRLPESTEITVTDAAGEKTGTVTV